MNTKPKKLTKAKKSRPPFVQAVAAETFAGVKLHPITKQREVVAAEMGLKNGFYPMKRQYWLRDTIILVWLCSIPVQADPKKGGWDVDTAEANPEAAMEEALKWATKKGIGINTPRFFEAFKIYSARIKAIQDAVGEPDLPDEAKTEDPTAGEL